MHVEILNINEGKVIHRDARSEQFTLKWFLKYNIVIKVYIRTSFC